MAYIEHDQLDAQLKKLENVCAENGFTYKFLRDKYPVRIIISPDTSMDGQISILDNPVGYNSRDCSISFVFNDGDLTEDFGKGGGLVIKDSLLMSFRRICKKISALWMKVVFINLSESKKLANKMQGGGTNDSIAQDPEFEAIGDGEILADENVEADGNSAPTAAQADASDDSASGNDNE